MFTENPERFESLLRLLDGAPFHRSRPWRLAVGAGGIVAITLIVYAYAVVVNGLFLQDRSTLNGVASLFTLSHLWVHPSGAYRPLTLSLLWLQRRGFGELPMPYHCVAVVIHAANCVLLWWILRRLGVPGAWLAAALFAAHPVQVQSVAWITQQPLLFCTFFYLLSLWLYLRWLQIRPPIPEKLAGMEPESDPPTGVLYVMALVACVVAVLSDPLGLSLPLVLLLLVWWKRGPLSRSDANRLAPFFAVMLIGLAGNILLHRSFPDPFGPAPRLSMPQRVMIGARAIDFYAINLLRLYPAELIHPRWDLAQMTWTTVSMVVIGIWGLASWIGRRLWGGALLVSFVAFIVLLLPTLVTVLSQPAPAIYVADPHQYLASAVLLALLAAGLLSVAGWISAFMPLRASRGAIGIIAIGLFAAFAFAQSLTYRDAETGLKTALSHHPSNTLTRAQYALVLLDQDPPQALKVLDDAGSVASADLALLDARARVCTALGRDDEAIGSYLSIQRLVPEYPWIPLRLAEAYDNAGVAAMGQGRRDDAFEYYDDALAACQVAGQLDPNDPLIDDRIGTVMLHEGRITESIAQFDAAVDRDPACVAARVHKAQALFGAAMQGDGDQMAAASAELKEVFRIDPANAEAFCTAANMQFQSGNFTAAEMEYRSAIKLNPGSAQAWTNLGFALAAQKRFEEAVRSFERALSLQSDAPDALRGKRLAQARLATGNPKS